MHITNAQQRTTTSKGTTTTPPHALRCSETHRRGTIRHSTTTACTPHSPPYRHTQKIRGSTAQRMLKYTGTKRRHCHPERHEPPQRTSGTRPCILVCWEGRASASLLTSSSRAGAAGHVTGGAALERVAHRRSQPRGTSRVGSGFARWPRRQEREHGSPPDGLRSREGGVPPAVHQSSLGQLFSKF